MLAAAANLIGTPVHENAADMDSVLMGMLRASHLLEPDDLADHVHDGVRRLGGSAARIYLADYEQDELRLLARRSDPQREVLPIDSTVAGRVFRTEKSTEMTAGDVRHVLLPLIDGTHRIGVLDLELPMALEAPIEEWEPLSALVADMIITKASYGDGISVTRRRRPMELRAEAQRGLLPPLTLISERVLVTGMLVPSYEVAGDLFDYALNGDTLHFAILDAMGHSLSATLTASVAIAAYRNSRRRGGSLLDRWRTADEAVAREFDDRFATAVLGELDLTDGCLRSVSAGHPPALVVRENRVVARCADEPTLPVGLGGEEPTVTETHLQPGDRLLLFTDGIVEARSREGDFFGEDRLVEQIARELDTGLPAPEAVRRLVRTVADHQDGRMRDDATLMLVEWRGASREEPAPAAT